MSELADEKGNNKARNGGERVGDCHQSAGVVWCNVDRIGQDAAIGAGHKHCTESHEGDGGITIASRNADARETQRR